MGLIREVAQISLSPGGLEDGGLGSGFRPCPVAVEVINRLLAF